MEIYFSYITKRPPMSRKKGSWEPYGLTISYNELGVVNIDELAHAILEDIQALKDIYNVRFVNGTRLRLLVTNEYGEELRVIRPSGGRIFYMDTHHYRPACKDYDL
jgi:hypothetical protein